MLPPCDRNRPHPSRLHLPTLATPSTPLPPVHLHPEGVKVLNTLGLFSKTNLLKSPVDKETTIH